MNAADRPDRGIGSDPASSGGSDIGSASSPYFEPFFAQTVQVFRQMCKIELHESSSEAVSEAGEDLEITAHIGLLGEGTGRLVLEFSEKVACSIISKITGTRHEEADPDVLDGLGELANIIAGNACQSLQGRGFGRIELTSPSVGLSGRRKARLSGTSISIAERRYTSNLGSFDLEVQFRPCSSSEDKHHESTDRR